uniref:ARID domain-containing protein n=2 Tax=Homalodisca liturata TaxID=320908 RepID=A0A1B6JRH5_9HEMI
MDFKLIGAPCGQHGPYTFYKAFKYSKHGKTNILALSEFFFVKLWNDSDLVSIGELQLLWEDKNSEQTLASLRLYILPENTPEGRSDCHGEHEVLAITEKVVLRVEDLLTWITEAADWSWGLSAVYDRSAKLMPRPSLLSDNSVIDLAEVDKEKDQLGESHWDTKSGVVVLSFPRYCRYRGILKRLEGVHNKWLRTALVTALGGFTVPCRNTRVLYCKETFDYPDIEGHELLCNHLAPKLKGRPRKKRKQLDQSPDSSDSESESSSNSTSSSSTKVKYSSPQRPVVLGKSNVAPSITSLSSTRRPAGNTEERDFLSRLHAFMKARQTPINRVPTIGFKELDLYKLYSKVRHLGGYDAVTSSRLWKYVYEEMGGDQSSTSAATCCRRHYERLLLPFERYLVPNRSKNSTLAKLKKMDEISITPKSPAQNDIHENNSDPLKIDAREAGPLVRLTPSTCYLTSEIIDLSSDDSPIKNEVVNLISDDDSQSPVKMKPPLLNITTKKQKLEILKEGGLEVTPISTVANGRTVPIEKPRPSVIQHAAVGIKPRESITITPDLGHMLPNSHAWGLGSQSVYGNPKEVLHGSSRPAADEILDLRTKTPYAPVGSNLEITLVPPASQKGKKSQLVPTPNRPNNSQKLYHPRPHTQPVPAQKPVHKPLGPSPTTSISNGRAANIVPSVSISVNQKKKSKAAPPHSSQAFPPYKSGPYPMMDPVYLSAFYSGLFTPFSAATTPQQLQMYKDLLHRQNIPDSFPRLLQDGSTSISLVNQTPTPPSK